MGQESNLPATSRSKDGFLLFMKKAGTRKGDAWKLQACVILGALGESESCTAAQQGQLELKSNCSQEFNILVFISTVTLIKQARKQKILEKNTHSQTNKQEQTQPESTVLPRNHPSLQATFLCHLVQFLVFRVLIKTNLCRRHLPVFKSLHRFVFCI